MDTKQRTTIMNMLAFPKKITDNRKELKTTEELLFLTHSFVAGMR